MKQWIERLDEGVRSRRRRLPGASGGAQAADYYTGIRSITEAPPPGASRWLLWVFIGLVVGTLLWATLASIEVVAFARGETIVGSRVQNVQAPERAVVSGLLVEDGDSVHAGQSVAYLERSEAEAEADELRYKLDDGRVARERFRALVAAFEEEREHPQLEPPDGVDDTALFQQRALMVSQWQSHRATISQLREKRRSRMLEAATIESRVEALEAELPYFRQRVDRLAHLSGDDLASQAEFDEAEQMLVERRHELSVQQRRYNEAHAAVDVVEREIDRTQARFIEQLRQRLAETNIEIAGLRERLVRAEKRLERRTLRAPIAGSVQDIAVHTQGAVVRAGDTLMRIAPPEGPVEIDAKIQHEDIGFARVGQLVDVKFDAFDFMRYGSTQGRIREIASGATPDEELGSVYRALIELERNHVVVEGERLPIRPGMTVSVDIEMGSRRVIEYFLEPILRYGDETLRER